MTFQKIQFDKIILTAAGAGLVSCAWLDTLIFRPNRLSAGNGISLFETDLILPVVIMILSWFLLIFISFLRQDRLNSLAFWIANLILVSTLWIGGEYASRISNGDNPFVRVSLGSGSWVIIFTSLVIIMDSYQKSAKRLSVRLYLIAIPLIVIAGFLLSGFLDNLSLIQEYINRKDRFYGEFIAHLQLAFGASGLSAIVGIPLGIHLTRRPILSQQSFFVLNIIQTIPSIALFGLLIAPLALLSAKVEFLRSIGFQGIGWAPALIALFLYSLLPIVRNTYTGLLTIDPSVIESAYGMGMTRGQVLRRVKIPLASGVILNGFRIATVQSIGNTAVAALIGAGGFGIFIFQGLGQAATDLILLGAFPTIIIAVFTDLILQGVIGLVEPRSTA